MFGKTEKPAAANGDTLIGAGTVVHGHIRFSGGLRIDGAVKGNLFCCGSGSGSLVVGEHGSIEGDVEATRLVVNGRISGRVEAREFVRLQSKARLDCDLDYAQAEIHSGAVVCGRLSQRRDGVEPVAAAERDVPPAEWREATASV